MTADVTLKSRLNVSQSTRLKHPQACLDLLDRSQMIEVTKRISQDWCRSVSLSNLHCYFSIFAAVFFCRYFPLDEEDDVTALQ